jgi:hypothetical protein
LRTKETRGREKERKREWERELYAYLQYMGDYAEMIVKFAKSIPSSFP